MQTALVILLLTVATVCSASLSITTLSNSPNAVVTKKLAKVNAVISAVVNPAFVQKTTQAIASQDAALKNVIVAIYNVPILGFACLSTSGAVFFSEIESGKITPANITEAFASACPLWKSKITNVASAVSAMRVQYSETSPTIISNLPNSFQNVISTLNNVTTKLINDGNSFFNASFYEDSVNQLVTQIEAIGKADRKAFSTQIPWLGPAVNKNGKYANALSKTLNLVNIGFKNGFNTTAIATQLTKVSTGLSTTLPAITTWLYKKIDALKVDSATASDSTVNNIAQTLSQYVSAYGHKIVASSEVQDALQTLVSGSYKFTG